MTASIAAMQASVADMKERVATLQKMVHEANRESVELQLAIEEAEGRMGSYHAKWARAWLAGDMDECRRLLKAEYPQSEVTL